MIGTGANVYQEFYGAGSSVDSAGAVTAGSASTADGHMQVKNECSGGYIYLYGASGGIVP